MKKLLVFAFAALTVFTTNAATIDTAKSTIYWQGTKVTGRHFGTVKIKSGDVKVEKGQLVSGTVVVDMNSFTATDLEGEWLDKLNGHLKNEDFFNVKKYPTATLKIKEVKGFTVKADMTIMGKTKEVTFLAANNGKKFVGTLEFDRTDFGIKYGSKSFFKSLGDKAIDNKVSLAFNVVLK
ncbi:YceI-like domain protein [Halobacteriovorax sp. BALOs_7]|uniref:YceI family protein n=1 Tax=unclassified Halobacteriovorax TaxID=2639665 RepID=UPI000EA185CE|nr:YceI family protein [Halobacteriovorax sp. BALOs_7]AYF44058.1 YceI-like domain protein [Halobacteriovorax sp. BALOs_7]